jgi:hypothetical protein
MAADKITYISAGLFHFFNLRWKPFNYVDAVCRNSNPSSDCLEEALQQAHTIRWLPAADQTHINDAGCRICPLVNFSRNPIASTQPLAPTIHVPHVEDIPLRWVQLYQQTARSTLAVVQGLFPGNPGRRILVQMDSGLNSQKIIFNNRITQMLLNKPKNVMK